jgi:autotransporter-associated beta strand protein
MGSLTTASGSVDISDNTSATAIDMGSLTTATGSINITDNTSATVIDMGSLTTSSGNVDITGNTSATVIDMGSLTTASGSVDISDNTSATAIDMNALTTASGSVVITGNTSATVIDMSSLTTVTGNVNIMGNTSATVVDMSSLTTVGGNVDITDNTSATVVDMSSLTTVSGNVLLGGGDFLTSGGSFSRSATQTLTVQSGASFDATPPAAAPNVAGTAGGTLSSAGTIQLTDAEIRFDGGDAGDNTEFETVGKTGGAGGLFEVNGGSVLMSGNSSVTLNGGKGGNGQTTSYHGGNGGNGGTLLVSAGTFTVDGGTVSLAGGAGGSGGIAGIAGAAGLLNVTGGTFTMNGGEVVTGTLQLSGTGVFSLDGGKLILNSIAQGAGAPAFNFGGGTLQAGAAFSSSLPMTLTGINGNSRIHTNAHDLTLAGPISGSGGLEKQGAGVLTLNGPVDYTGDTTITAGTLEIDNGLANTLSTISGTGNLTVGGATTLNAVSINVDSLTISTASVASVPEPSTLLLLALAGCSATGAFLRR